ncbi:IS66 family transposase, partial [Pseudoflavonifractor phocaeensis]|uniref:IS66 family transposase n=1 Tax=Pseudoflavonifractor phocaeensis TaxID=1870988 RepID=UPI001FAF69A9
WLKTIHPEKGSKLEDAVRYSLNQAQQLTAFLDAPEISISNNLAENAIRPFVVGRKNWLFCDSVKGAESSAIV